MTKDFSKIKQQLKYRHLFGLLVIKNIKNKYRRSMLGVLWTILHPLLNMLVMTFVFSQIFSRVENFPIYLMAGSVLFSFKTEATNMCMNSIVGNRGLITKVYVPEILFPLSNVFSSLVNLGFALIALLGVIIVLQFPLTPVVLMFFVMLPSLVLFSAGLGFILAALNVFFRDTSHLYGIFNTLWMYLTPIFYPIDNMSQEVQNIIRVNPMFHYIDYFRSLLLNQTVPDFSQLAVCYAWGVVLLVLGISVFNRMKKRFILFI